MSSELEHPHDMAKFCQIFCNQIWMFLRMLRPMKRRQAKNGFFRAWLKEGLGGPWSQMLKIVLSSSLKCRCAEHTKWKMKFTCF